VHPSDSDSAVLARHVALHFPHKRSPEVRDWVHHPWVAAVLAAVLGPDVKVVQSMFFIRPPGGPGQAWHQDARYVPAPVGQLAGLWLALEPATVESGCLWVVPGSHRRGSLWPHGPHDDPRYDLVHGVELSEAEAQAAVPVPCEEGEVVLFSGHLLHRALPNRSGGFRRALALHAVPAGLLMPWMGAEQRPDGDCRDFELVAGVDPRAHLPREELLEPWLRPARL
jgi:ectoine hydroxylase-related dioxygenase (phytanoyl-CoA dioxygenase family)